VCGVWNGYNGDSVRQADCVETLDCRGDRWYRNVVSRGSAVLRDALLPISGINLCASSAKTPRVSTATIIIIIIKSIYEVQDCLRAINALCWQE